MSLGTSEPGQVSLYVGISSKCSLVPKSSHPIGKHKVGKEVKKGKEEEEKKKEGGNEVKVTRTKKGRMSQSTNRYKPPSK